MIFSNRNLYFVMIALLVADVVYSFLQHYSATLDGDLPLIVVPAEWYSHVLKDPFGLRVLLTNDFYESPNRFFVHWPMSFYYKNVPLWLQNFMSPIDSIYVASAIAKILIQVGIISVLSVYLTRLTMKKGLASFFLAAILMTPLFQANGYNVMMGIIDKSPTYTFFYAAPLLGLLIFYLPFCTSDWGKEIKFGWSTHFLLLLLAIILPFSGPLVAGVVLIVCPMGIVHFLYKNYEGEKRLDLIKYVKGLIRIIPPQVLIYFSLISLLSLYSLYVGTHNSENLWETLPLSERFSRLPVGIVNLLITKLGFPLILLMIGWNIFMIRKYHKHDPEAKKITTALVLIAIFVVIYILLLPLGGYRSYRPNILRRDTIMPVTIALFFIYGWSSYYLLHYVLPSMKKVYIAISVLFCLAFTIADNPGFEGNQCERKQLEYLARSKEKNVLLDNECVIMAWENRYDSKSAKINNQLLLHLGIIQEKKYYYNK